MDNQSYSLHDERVVPNLWRIIAIVLFIMFIAIGGVYLFNSQSQKSVMISSQQSVLPQQLQPTAFTPQQRIIETEIFNSTGNCTIDECLIGQGLIADQDFAGLAKVQGYYHRYDTKDWGDQPVVCDGFIVIGGSNRLIDSFRNLIKQGNGLNKLTPDNKLIMNISIEDLDENLKNKIQQSSDRNPIELRIMRKIQGGMGVSTCHSFVDILSAQ